MRPFEGEQIATSGFALLAMTCEGALHPPLAGAANNAYVSTVDIISGSGANGKSIRHTQRQPPFPVIAQYKATSLQQVQRGQILKPQV